MKKLLRTMLVLEPHEKSGLSVRVLTGQKFLFSRTLAHGDDIVVALSAARPRLKKCAAIIVRSHVGSFSASRAALVAANIMAALHHIPIYFVEQSCNTPEEIYAACAAAVKKFSYAQEAHITLSK